MITETEYSIQAAKDIPRKERPKENDSSFQDIFTALTATLQMANPQAANTLSNGIAQTTGKNIQNTVRETSRRSGQDKKDFTDRLDPNNSKKTDRPFLDKNPGAQDNPKTNNKSLKNDRTTNEVQTSKKERTSLKPDAQKNMGDSGPAPESKEDFELNANTQDASPDEKEIKDTEPDLNKLFKTLTGQDLPNNISNTQDLSQDSSVNQQLLTLLNEQGDKIEDLLVKAGMSETDAKNLLNKIETRVENSIQVRQALNGNLPAIEPQNPAETTDSFLMDKKVGSEVDAGSADKTIEFLPDTLSQIPKNQTEVKTDNKKDVLAGLSAKPEGKDQIADIPADKGKEALLQAFSSDQSYNIFSSQNSSSQDSDTDIKSLLNSSKNISEVSAKVSEPTKAASNTPNNLFADLSAKSINEIKQAHASEIINNGTIEKPVINQIIEKFSLRTNGQQNEINIKLDPPDLGTVRINITSEGDHVKTTLITENHAVKQAIESNLSQLRDSMSDQGLKVQSFTVLVGGHQGQKGQNQQQQQGQANLPGAPFQESAARQENGGTVLSGRPGFYDKSQSISVFA